MRLYVERGWLAPDLAAKIGAEFPDWESPAWHTFSGPREEGKQAADYTVAGPLTIGVHADLASLDFVEWLRVVFSEPSLLNDPDLRGAGIHQCAPGGRLALHQDFNVNPDRTMVRSVNVIVFVSEPGISERDPGALVLYDGNQLLRIAPEPGLLVAFSAECRTWHGHPEPMRDDQPRRRSIPAYYYRPIRETEQVVPRDTTWLNA